MSQNNSNDKAAMMAIIENINKVEGFDPAPFAVDFTDLNALRNADSVFSLQWRVKILSRLHRMNSV